MKLTLTLTETEYRLLWNVVTANIDYDDNPDLKEWNRISRRILKKLRAVKEKELTALLITDFDPR